MAILSTVGTSILGNVEAAVGRGGFDVSGLPDELVGRLRNRELSRLSPNDPYQEVIRNMAYGGNAFFERVIEFLRSNPSGASAELNTIMGFLGRNLPYKGSINEVELYFYPTDTGNSQFCASVLREYLERYGEGLMRSLGLSIKPKVNEPIVIKGLGANVEWFREGLLELVDKFARMIVNKRKDGYRVVVNATAGFKPETMYIAMMAQLAGAWRIIYMHESFREVIELPKLPIAVDNRYVDIIKKIGRGVQEYVLRDMGVDVDELEDLGLVVRRDGMVEAREWIVKLLELLSDG